MPPNCSTRPSAGCSRSPSRRPRGGGGFQPLKTLLGKAVERIEILFQRDEPITGLATGFTDFDMMTSGCSTPTSSSSPDDRPWARPPSP